MPPQANPIAPSNAEAIPALLRWHSIAKAVVDVKVSPMPNKRANNNASYTQKLHPCIKARHSAKARISMATQPDNVLLRARWKRTDNAAATPMAIALMAKQTLNTNGE